MIEFRKAGREDAACIAATRQKAWNATYRGIYPDEQIDGFDYLRHTRLEEGRLADQNYHCCLVMDGTDCAGYFSYGTGRDGRFWLYSLYLLPSVQKQGLGRRIFELIRDRCLAMGQKTMTLNCSPHNKNALAFYTHMGGTVVTTDAGHENPQEDGCIIQYHFT